MPKLKRQTSQVEDSGFAVYDGDEPPRGVYRGKIKQCRLRESKNGNLYFNCLVELEGNEGAKKQYNGWPGWTMITLTDKDANIRREKSFYRAVCGKEDVDVVYNDLDKGSEEDRGKVTKIGGKSPIGVPVLLEVRTEMYEGQQRSRGDSILPAKAAEERADAGEPDEPEEDDDLLEDEDVDIEDEDVEEAPGDDEDADDEEADSDDENSPENAVGDDDEGDSDDSDEPDVTREELEALPLPRLRKKVLELWGDDFEADDLKGMKKGEILDMLEEDEFIGDGDPF